MRNLVVLHGGTVTGQSAGPGTGSLFRVTLPRVVATDQPPDQPLPAEVQLETLHGARILVVDDEADARELMARILRDRRAAVLLAASADEALALVCDERPDLIVSDIGMPGKDGLEFIQEVRALPGREALIPAIALTAFARPEDCALALRCGFQKHLGKPIDSLAVTAACADLLAAHASSERAAAA